MFNRQINYSIYLLAKLAEQLDAVVFKLVTWQEPNLLKEAELLRKEEPSINLDEAENPDDGQVTLREFDLGDVLIECPECGEVDNIFLVGIALYQDDEDNEEETFDITTIGMIAYACGDVVYSICLTDKVAAILNASDNHTLTLDMLANINTCDEHGVLHTEE